MEPENYVVLEIAEKQVVSVGGQGPPGRDGLNGSGGVEFQFSYGDATPAVVTTALSGKLVYKIEIYLEVAFDGVGAALKVGDAGQADRLVAANENDPTQAVAYECYPNTVYEVDTQITLSITPGSGATQGSGVLVVYVQQ